MLTNDKESVLDKVIFFLPTHIHFANGPNRPRGHFIGILRQLSGKFTVKSRLKD